VAFDLIATALASFLLVVWMKERVLYVIFAWAYVQNFVLAWMYTSGWAGRNLCQALLIAKEFMLLFLFLYFLPGLNRRIQGRWPLPLRILGFFTAWCMLRYAAAVVFQGESLFGNLWNLRMACFPFEILAVSIAVAFEKPQFALKFIRSMVYLVAALAAVGIFLYLAPATSFWHDHVDISSYNSEVKGESPAVMEPADFQAEASGVTGNGLSRAAFSFLSAFRAFGTVGDAVGFGHFVAFPILLLAFWLPRNWKTRLMLLAAAGALFFSFTRSAWIFVAVGSVYLLLRKGSYRFVFSLAGAAVVALLTWGPLAEWYSASMSVLSWNNPDSHHAEGLVWIYKEGLWQAGNIFGQGMTANIPESGYGVLLVRYGLPAVLGLAWFCFALYRSLQQSSLRNKTLFLIAQAVPIAFVATLNFSYYPFSFIPYVLTWFVVGFCLAAATATAQKSLSPAELVESGC
jgi:hypothetical protein